MSETLFDPETGELASRAGFSEEDGLREALEVVQGDLKAAEAALRSERRKVARLQEELKRQRREAPEAQLVQMVFDFWVRTCGKDTNRTKLGEKREKAVLARLRDGFTPEYVQDAIRGAAVACYVDPSSGLRYDDLELICRNEVNLERFYERWHLHPGSKVQPEPPA